MSKGKLGKREKPLKTKTGIVVHYAGKNDFKLEYPDGEGRWGGVTTLRLINFFYHLGHGKTLEQADKLAFEEIYPQ